jgi:hypothetical protein
MLMPTQQRR